MPLSPLVLGSSAEPWLDILLVPISLGLIPTLIPERKIPACADNRDGLQKH